jgi:hypothetical protein
MNIQQFVQQLDGLINTFNTLSQSSKYDDLSDKPLPDRQSLVTRTVAAINRISGSNSVYSKEVARTIKNDPDLHIHMTAIIGIAKALREDINDGYINSLIELTHADIFSDFLEMATHLNDSNYKDPAAVLAGSTLESHLKKLANKNTIAVDINGKPVKADKLNADLVKANAYGSIDQKNVTAWLGLRNDAAHGNYTAYTRDQVKLLISSIQDFITRNPA